MFPPKKPGKIPSAMGQIGYPSPQAQMLKQGTAPVVVTQSSPKFGRTGANPKSKGFAKSSGKRSKGAFFTGGKHPVSGEPF